MNLINRCPRDKRCKDCSTSLVIGVQKKEKDISSIMTSHLSMATVISQYQTNVSVFLIWFDRFCTTKPHPQVFLFSVQLWDVNPAFKQENFKSHKTKKKKKLFMHTHQNKSFTISSHSILTLSTYLNPKVYSELQLATARCHYTVMYRLC